jgi:hypothetical protein
MNMADKNAVVVYVDADPTNVVGIFFAQPFPGGKTATQAAADFQADLSGTTGFVPSDQRAATVDDYNLVVNTDVNLSE